MAASRVGWKAVPVYLVILAICAVNTSSVISERRLRHVASGDNGIERRQSSRGPDHSIPNSSSSDNELASDTGKKVSHRLVGGHMRFETTTGSPLKREKKEREKPESIENEADETDEASWDDGLVISSAGNGKEKNTRPEDDDEKKTLSQQVKEGKYGLIQNEIYRSRPKRPGIISYLSNPEVPRDNAKNLGGLDEEEIWLAENHVLVLRGGNFPDHEKDDRETTRNVDDWSPIDDYKAPKRQVKIPPRPKIPPPFPVQLSDDGPVQIIGLNGTSAEGQSSDDENESPYNRGYLPGEGPFFGASKNGTMTKEDLASQENTTSKLEINDEGKKTKSGHVPPRKPGVIGPFYPSLPPGAVFVVPPSNQSDYDEDDQSIYYPPPYSFYYKQDNSTPVPPGPLVPGIILPPPPDFFSGSEERKPTTKNYPTKYSKRPSTTPLPRASPTYYPPRKSSAKPYKVTTSSSVAGKVSTSKYASRGSSFTMKPVNGIKWKTTTGRSTSKPIRVKEKDPLPRVEVTTPSIGKATNLEITELYTSRPNVLATSIASKTSTDSNDPWISNVSSKPVPLVTYYSSSTPATVDEPVEATPGSVKNVVSTGKQGGTSNQASYYFYEEANEDVGTGTSPDPTLYYRQTTEAPYYKIQELPQHQQQQQQQERREHIKKSYYQAQVAGTLKTPKDQSAGSLDPISKTPARYHAANSGTATNSVITSRSKGQRMLAASPPTYYEDTTENPRIQLQSYYETTKPSTYASGETQNDNRYDYDQGTKPKPIYQYSFEAANYYKRGKQENYYKPETQRGPYFVQDDRRPAPTAEPFDEWQDIRDENQQYDYEGTETLPEQEIEPERENPRYKNRLPVTYRTTTGNPIIDTTESPHHLYYTKQDEQLLDDVTREYFTNFGKKLRGESLPATTPIYAKTRVVTDRPDYTEVESYVSNNYDNVQQTATYKPPRVRVHYGDQAQRPYSLETDTRVNYKDPPPATDPESEWIPGFDPKQSTHLPLQNYRQHHTEIVNRQYAQANLPVQRFSQMRNYPGQRLIGRTNNSPTNFVPLGESGQNERETFTSARPISLEGDIAVNYRDPRPPVNPDAEFIDPNVLRNNNNGEKSSYFAYRLPGDSGHFYFLTPQAISQRQDDNDGYIYPRPRGVRFSRQRRRGARNS